MLIGYADANWANDQDDGHSISGNVFVFGGAVGWLTKIQAIVALSKSEAQYVGMTSAAQEAIWLKRLLCDLKMPIRLPIVIQEENQGGIAVAKNPVFHGRNKHSVHYNFIREAVMSKTIVLEFCKSKNMVANLFTKALSKSQF